MLHWTNILTAGFLKCFHKYPKYLTNWCYLVNENIFTVQVLEYADSIYFFLTLLQLPSVLFIWLAKINIIY